MEEYFQDEWPTMEDGTEFDGTGLLDLVRAGKSPFLPTWDVNFLIQEIERVLNAKVVDIPVVSSGSNHYGFHLKMSNHVDVVARLARGDVNMPHFDGFELAWQVSEVQFEAAIYDMFRLHSVIPISSLLYHRVPVQHVPQAEDVPEDILGRRLMVFERAEGADNTEAWEDLDEAQIAYLLDHAASIRASLFKYNLASEFSQKWFLDRLFEQKPRSLPFPVEPTREFCVALFMQKIQATIRNIGDMIGWESDNAVVGPVAFAAKQSLLKLVPYILPQETNDGSLYRLVLDHLDYGIHNTLIAKGADGNPSITSVFDWETAYVVPAILSDPLFAALGVDLVAGEDGLPSVRRVPTAASADDLERYATWSRHYFKTLFQKEPSYLMAIQLGKDARYLWFTLRQWRGQDPEGYFGDLGAWAESKLAKLSLD